MKATNKIEASRIAYFGMRKMYQQGGYALENTKDPLKKWVVKEDGAMYLVSVKPEARRCDCPFFEENAEFAVCKHIYYVQEEIRREDNFQNLTDTLGLHGGGI